MKRKAREQGRQRLSKRATVEQPSPPHSTQSPGSSPAALVDSDLGDAAPPTPSSPQPSTPTTSSAAPARRRQPAPSDAKTLRCPQCPKLFNRPARLAAHARSHSGERPFVCTFVADDNNDDADEVEEGEGDGRRRRTVAGKAQCGRSYLEEKHLRQHVKSAHTHELAHVCTVDDCGRKFVTATRLRRHVAGVHEGGVRCKGYDGCERVFRKRATLLRHVRADHMGLKPFVCKESEGVAGEGRACEATFDSAPELRRHVVKVHGEIAFWCDECNARDGGNAGQVEEEDDDEDDEENGLGEPKSKDTPVGFRTLVQLKEHLRKEHINCIFCDRKSFPSNAALEDHLEMYHSGQTVADRKVVKCTHPGCDKTFTKKANLKTHIKSAHEGLRFVCGLVDFADAAVDIAGFSKADGCGALFSTKGNLELHVRHVHLGQPRRKYLPASADAEAKVASLLDDLAGVTDSAKRTIPCPVDACDAAFIRYHDLQMHMAVHEEVTVEQAGDFGLIEDSAPLLAEPFMSQASPLTYEASDMGWADTAGGPEFWVGDAAVNPPQPDNGHDSSQWQVDEAAMESLLGAYTYGHLIDPALRA